MTGRTGISRKDLDNREIAIRWIEGMSILKLSVEYDCDIKTIKGRLAKARAEFPEFAWDERKAKVSRNESETKNYVKMNDGKPGESSLVAGSIVRSAELRKRNR